MFKCNCVKPTKEKWINMYKDYTHNRCCIYSCLCRSVIVCNPSNHFIFSLYGWNLFFTCCNKSLPPCWTDEDPSMSVGTLTIQSLFPWLHYSPSVRFLYNFEILFKYKPEYTCTQGTQNKWIIHVTCTIPHRINPSHKMPEPKTHLSTWVSVVTLSLPISSTFND